ncbi:MAG: ThuA domain-containing protein [Kiritimatiellae bacterium]|nr:ThuA domain-containing protein [Kiritimatiellia bacterium]MDD5520887.1 ThuA domain-containing protein [Kiritimatiellia bacterium]
MKQENNVERNDCLVSRRDFLRNTAVVSIIAGIPLVVGGTEEGEQGKIEAAIPDKAPAIPRKPRKLLIFDLNVGYGGHRSIPTAGTAFTLMGKKTGAFETVITRDPAVFKRESLKQFDAVFLNNTVGNLFEDHELRQNLLEFVCGGGGLMGVHGTSVAFVRWKEGGKEDWHEFAVMLGMRGAAHRANTEKVFMKLEEPQHPILKCFGDNGFEMQDEFFRPKGTYSRNRDRVLLGFDLEKTDLKNEPHDGCYREDKDYAMAWVRQYGRGRIFYTSFGHHPVIFQNPKLLEFYLAGIQFILGDLPAPTIPSGKLTPAIRVQEKLGWRLGVEACTFHKYTFFEAVEKMAELGLVFIGALSFQKVSKDIPKLFDPSLTDDELREIRLKLDSAGIRLLTYYIQAMPGDEEGCRKVFEFGRKMGIETFVSEPAPETLGMIDRFCEEYKINVALHNHDPKASPNYWNPEGILKACEGRTRRIGACPDLGYWMRAGIDPIKGVNMLKDRIITLHMHDLNELSPQGHDVPWGTGVGKTEEVLREVHRQGIKPTMFGIEYSDNMPEIKKCIEFFDKISLEVK